ncbi:MAG: hypothetical protein EHM78_07875 [Myxococcaceae bacterium]|nr:MAG: hypothetical protein EHM78_07875 [Myxococcaceae bacterium]
MVPRALPFALLLAAGCAHAPVETAPAPDWGIARASTVDTFEIGGQADHWGVRVTDDEILGIQPDFALGRSNGEIRGRAAGVPVVVGFSEDEGAGVYRGAPFQVKVERTPAGLLVNGIFGGAISTFELSVDRINGRIGTCGWDVRWTGSYYSGSRGCGTRIEPVSVSLPATMARWSDVEVAGALAILMNVGAPRGTDRLVDNSAEFRNPSNAALAPYYRMASSARPGGPATGFGRPLSSSAGAPSRVSAPRRMAPTPSTPR